jgi:Xaa-Pro aminopeptidase
MFGSAAALAAAASGSGAKTPGPKYDVPSSREQFEIKKGIVAEKLGQAILPAMRKHGIDMWITMDRENHYEPLHDELGGGYSGVRAAFIFFDNGGAQPEKIFINSHSQAENAVITRVYDVKRYYGYTREGIVPHLREIVTKRNPKKIGVNTSKTLPDADGLTVALKELLMETIGPDLSSRIVSAELVTRDFRTNRTALETKLYKQLLQWSSDWMTEGLSAIQPGKTTSEDLAWWLEDKASEIGMKGGGSVRTVRKGDLLKTNSAEVVFQPGDIISIDGGLDYLGYATDIKRAAYILMPGEAKMPVNLQKAWDDTLRFADLYNSLMKPGAIGHEIHARMVAEGKKKGFKEAFSDAGGNASSTYDPELGVYGHSVGTVAHDIGARVAENSPFAFGDRVRFPLVLNEWVSIEFHLSTPIPEWGGKTWYARYEENAQVGPNGIVDLIPRQEKLILVPAKGKKGA